VTVPVPLAKLPSIKVGQEATVNPPGLGALKGAVSQVALLPSSSTGNASSTVTYDVTITLPDTPQTLATGTYATATITTAAASNVLTVPVSAIPSVTSASAQVTVLKNDTATPTAVTVGAVGGGLAEIRSGLSAGDQVVIADASAPLPTNNSNNVRGLTGTGGPPGATGNRTGTTGFGGAPGVGGVGGGR
jgi:multidrug efflux pump subunit AcrA (membrane-fusion protein)